MKAEDFFRLSLDQIFDVDNAEIDKHFKKFKRNFSKLPIVLDSLQNELKDQNGIVLVRHEVKQEIEKLKNNIRKFNPELMNSFIHMLYSWFDLFLHEIGLQIYYASLARPRSLVNEKA